MTHSLHRQGTAESLRQDYVFLMDPTYGTNSDHAIEGANKVIDALIACGAINWSDRDQVGDGRRHSEAEFRAGLNPRTRLRGVLTSKEAVVRFLTTCKESDPGISIIISGLIGEVEDACAQAGLVPHSTNFSLGVWGKTELLPSPDYLALTTMCGHHLISTKIVEKGIEDIKAGRSTIDQVCDDLNMLCPCGLFNVVRAHQLLKEMAEQEES